MSKDKGTQKARPVNVLPIYSTYKTQYIRTTATTVHYVRENTQRWDG